MKRVCVLGLGYIGLPTSIALASAGVNVVGVDTDPGLLERLGKGQVDIGEPGLEDMLSQVIRDDRIFFSPHPMPSDSFIIAVPTPLQGDQKADLSFVLDALDSIMVCLEAGNLIVIESSVPPYFCQEVISTCLSAAGFTVGQDIFLAHCPERVLPGEIMHEIVHNPRLIGGCTPQCAQRAQQLYIMFTKGSLHLTDAATAEMTKLVENTYRDVNIALVNELSLICHQLGLNVLEVIRLANHHPRVSLINPGPGVGGHCLAVDPYFIVEKAPGRARLISLARQINSAMPDYIADTITTILKNNLNAKIAVFGLSYKGNVGDLRESPALAVTSRLKERGYSVSVFDPHVPGLSCSLLDAVQGSHLILILSDHDEFRDLDYSSLSRIMKRPIIFDTRHILASEVSRIKGCQVYNLGNIQEAWGV